MVEPGDRTRGQFAFNAGRLCLDFVNTVHFRPVSDRLELINSYDDLLAWARQATIITPGEAATLAEASHRRERSAADALAHVRGLRESTYAIFSSRAAGLPAREADLRTLNRAVGRAMAHAGLIPSGSRFEWAWPDVAPDLDRVAWWVARSAAELLTSDDITFVRECAGYDCGWLFMDTTKNRSRRWCDMRTCGNRAKSRRHYERRRAADGTGGLAD
ncbi:MAG TPA: ABATE domain-containing protein [Verrucomicrobiae bacterium]|jgi:predicted RNA-binding Zn ribbon-like protein|nr:ABATE domain-containing protein [Verrucomicrobiae bacterium]